MSKKTRKVCRECKIAEKRIAHLERVVSVWKKRWANVAGEFVAKVAKERP